MKTNNLNIKINRCEPGHEKTCLMSYVNNKGADQPAHLRSLISAFVVRCLDSVMSLVSVIKISSLMPASVAEQASLSLKWSETPEDIFSHDKAHVQYNNNMGHITQKCAFGGFRPGKIQTRQLARILKLWI